MSKEPQACPFCGHDARTLRYNGTFQAVCGNDQADCPGQDCMAPVSMWNRRAASPAMYEALEKIKSRAASEDGRSTEECISEVHDIADAALASADGEAR